MNTYIKNITAVLIIISAVTCKAQSPVYSLATDNYGETQNAYYKDVDHDLQNLVGTWKYTEGVETLKIILKEKQQQYTEGVWANYFRDVLYGEYIYTDENGVEIINSLNTIQQPLDEHWEEHLIAGNTILYQEPGSPGNRKVQLLIEDPERNYFTYYLTLQKPSVFMNNTTPYIKAIITHEGSHIISVPEGTLINSRLPINKEIKLYKVEY